jgi:hypothetical protein
MRRRCPAFVATVASWVAICPQPVLRSADSSHLVEIKLPASVPSEHFFVRYVLAGQDLGNWAYAPPGVSSFGIGTLVDGRPATEMKAILYAPGCAIQTLDLRLSGSGTIPFSFVCRPVRNVEVNGLLVRADRLWRHTVKLQTRYVARWATPFLGLDKTVPTSITVGDVTAISTEGRFHVVVPDFSEDLSAKQGDPPGEFQIWAKDETTGAIVAMLVPQESVRTRMGGLKVQKEYPNELTFAPCAASSAKAHDKVGFAIRPDASDACDPF